MELIVIKGKNNSGKTTTATLLHNKLTQIDGITLEWMKYDNWLLPVGKNDILSDFQSIFVYKGKIIGIISHGDTSRYSKQFIRQMINRYQVNVLVVCSSVDGRNWNMLNRDFGEYIKPVNIFEVNDEHWAKDEKDMIPVKERLVTEIQNHIVKLCNKL